MRPTLSRVIVTAVAAAALLTGCSSTVAGSAAPTGGGPSAPDLAAVEHRHHLRAPLRRRER